MLFIICRLYLQLLQYFIWDYFVWDSFVWEYFAIWDCFVWDCFVWDCFARTRARMSLVNCSHFLHPSGVLYYIILKHMYGICGIIHKISHNKNFWPCFNLSFHVFAFLLFLFLLENYCSNHQIKIYAHYVVAVKCIGKVKINTQ